MSEVEIFIGSEDKEIDDSMRLEEDLKRAWGFLAGSSHRRKRISIKLLRESAEIRDTYVAKSHRTGWERTGRWIPHDFIYWDFKEHTEKATRIWMNRLDGNLWADS